MSMHRQDADYDETSKAYQHFGLVNGRLVGRREAMSFSPASS